MTKMMIANDDSRKRSIHIRLNDKEHALLHRCADDLGVTVSDYVRLLTQLPQSLFVADEETKSISRSHLLVSSPATMHRILIEGGRWGTNYNQGVHALNLIVMLMKGHDGAVKYEDVILSQWDKAFANLEEAKEGIGEVIQWTRELQDDGLIVLIDNVIDARYGLNHNAYEVFKNTRGCTEKFLKMKKQS